MANRDGILLIKALAATYMKTRGVQKTIANTLDVSPSTIASVKNGTRKQTTITDEGVARLSDWLRDHGDTYLSGVPAEANDQFRKALGNPTGSVSAAFAEKIMDSRQCETVCRAIIGEDAPAKVGASGTGPKSGKEPGSVFSFDPIIRARNNWRGLEGCYLVFRLGAQARIGAGPRDQPLGWVLRTFPAWIEHFNDDLYYWEDYSARTSAPNSARGLVRSTGKTHWIFGTDEVNPTVSEGPKGTIGFLYILYSNWTNGLVGTISMVNELDLPSAYTVLFCRLHDVDRDTAYDRWKLITERLSLEVPLDRKINGKDQCPWGLNDCTFEFHVRCREILERLLKDRLENLSCILECLDPAKGTNNAIENKVAWLYDLQEKQDTAVSAGDHILFDLPGASDVLLDIVQQMKPSSDHPSDPINRI
jgi:hypothetical protein